MPLPYAFIPSHDGHDYRDPPTPVSLPSPSNTPNASTFFDSYVDGILNSSSQREESTTPTKYRQPINPTPSSHATPTIARTLAQTSIAQQDLESPDPLAMSGPSPSKKAKHNVTIVSPPRTHSSLKIKLNTSSIKAQFHSLPSDSRPATKRLTPEVVITVKKSSASPRKHKVEEEEEEEESGDELDWGDEGGMDQDGDYKMSDPAFTSPSPTRRIEPKGSGRTGERDQRCESIALRHGQKLIIAQLQRLQSLLEDIFEESDSFPAELSTEDLSSSKFFSTMSETGSHPLLSSRAISKIIEYMSRLKGKRRTDSPEWDLDAFTRILRLLERSMREVDEITVFDEPKSVEVKKAVKVGKGKKNSKSPELGNDDTPVKAEVELSDDQVHGLEADLQKIANAGIAAAAVLTLLDLEGLPKQVCCP
jgi:cohesin loading factor subunit SCC2